MTPRHGLPGATARRTAPIVRAARAARSALRARRAAAPPRRRRRQARSRRRRSGTITRERLLLAGLRRAQPPHRLVVARVDHQVEAAEALDRDDRAAARSAATAPASASSCSARARARRASHSSSCGPHAGQAFGCAWKRRSRGSSYSRLARRAHREAAPSSCAAGRTAGLDDREARAAVRAVGERVAVAAVGRVEDLAQAVGAGGDVGQHERGLARRPSLSRISKPAKPTGSSHDASRPWTTARGGRSRHQAQQELLAGAPALPRPRRPRPPRS